MPRFKRTELADGLKRVTLGPEAQTFRETATRIAEKHPAHAGREEAARMLLNLVRD
jgi:hypothetical protein